jgi:hypothetical protein
VAERRGESKPYIWVTWLRDILAGQASCYFAPWYKARFKFDKAPRRDEGSLSRWQGDHGRMVERHVAELRKAGHAVRVEDQNSFKLEGDTAIVAGKPDIFDETTATVVDEKSGKRKAGDWWQVAIYLVALPLAWQKELQGRQVRGVIQYQDGSVPIEPEAITPAVKDRILTLVRRIGNDMRPDPEPSYRECQFCDLTAADCPVKITAGPPTTRVDGGLF